MVEDLVGKEMSAIGLAVISGVAVIASILVQPTVGVISDYTITRWGRRKPYILIGGVFDMLFLYGIASSNTFVALVAFYFLIQVSSNFAQGPFQGYVPDLVPARQVGMASGLMGLMIVLGTVAGAGIAALGGKEGGSLFAATLALGAVEIVAMVIVVTRVHEGHDRTEAHDVVAAGRVVGMGDGHPAREERAVAAPRPPPVPWRHGRRHRAGRLLLPAGARPEQG